MVRHWSPAQQDFPEPLRHGPKTSERFGGVGLGQKLLDCGCQQRGSDALNDATRASPAPGQQEEFVIIEAQISVFSYRVHERPAVACPVAVPAPVARATAASRDDAGEARAALPALPMGGGKATGQVPAA